MNRNAIKISLDIVMTIVFIMLMDLSVTGVIWHEVLGLQYFCCLSSIIY
jgi:hypothetical protein